MNAKPFDHPVKFMATNSLVRHITSTDGALYFLEHKWPYVEGQAHQRAVQICREVLGGRGGAEKAKQAFLRALEEGQFDLVE
ncbi:hypothetical protein GCM10007874_31700 [Labrys miyagiensis]|uniref:DUF982 domain-containing protein n=1 Tax=Labrys miyagiensis TaxID=346912 RepID=A0ABQ6CKA7_9HYPH|nr:DUF982 domain-containing protein [Labrys miyagiensis]GLS20153.1 hypothetical protein GCM10007874_31700 [Labrys miyagiensis]